MQRDRQDPKHRVKKKPVEPSRKPRDSPGGGEGQPRGLPGPVTAEGTGLAGPAGDETSRITKSAGRPGDGMTNLTQTQQEALNSLASILAVPVAWPFNVITLETAKTWDPQIENNKSHAKGLIQFMPRTAQQLGYKDQYDLVNKNPTVEAQLRGPVLQYFKQFMPFPTEQSFYLSVFYPEYRYRPLDTIFPAIVQQYNPGIKTVGDYFNIVKRVAGSIPPAAKIGGLILIFGILGIVLKRYFQG